MLEILRRAVLVLGVYGTILASLHARPGVVETRLEDFAARQASRPGWSGDRALSPADYVLQETKDRAVTGNDPGWSDLAAQAEDVRRGEPPRGAWADRRGRGAARGSLFLLPDEAPLDGLRPPLSYDRPFVYARVLGPGDERWLALTWRRGADADGAPAALVRPLRAAWPWALLAGIATYVLLPRRRAGPDTLRYSTVRAGILPDVVGLLLGGLFFALAVAVPRAFTHDGEPWQPGAWPVYAVAGPFVLLAWTIHLWAAWYEAFRLDVRAAGFDLRTLGGARTVSFADVTEARLEPVRPPRALRRAMWIGALLDARILAQALLSSSRSDVRLVLRERSGRETRLLLTALSGPDRLLRAIEGAGIRVAPVQAGAGR